MQLPSMLEHSRQPFGLAVIVAVALALLASCAEAPATTTIEATPAATTFPEAATHLVVRGETLSTISRDRGVSVESLVQFNSIQNPDLIEPGLVLRLEPTAPAPAARTRHAEAPAPATDPVLTWLDDRWHEVRPHLTLSARSVQEGAVAGLLLPVVVVAVLALWFVASGARVAALAAWRQLPRRRSSEAANDALVAEAAAPAAGSGRQPARLATLVRRAVPRPSSAIPLRSSGSRFTARARRHLGRLTTSIIQGTTSAFRVMRERVRRSREARTERLYRENEESRQAALRTQCWRPGMEALRIGLLDEAQRRFETGLAAAQSEGWTEEIALFESSLERVRERLGVVALSSQA